MLTDETRRFEKGFTRYSVYFAGEELPNEVGMADAVYIFLNEDYWQVLNNAVFRPLDYDYQKALSAGAHQRFYELVSFAVFAALSKRSDEAKLCSVRLLLTGTSDPVLHASTSTEADVQNPSPACRCRLRQ